MKYLIGWIKWRLKGVRHPHHHLAWTLKYTREGRKTAKKLAEAFSK